MNMVLSQRIHINKCGRRMWSEKEKSDGSATRGLIPMHVPDAEWTNKALQGKLVFPLKGFWISKTNI
jgi:hypothetical protein